MNGVGVAADTELNLCDDGFRVAVALVEEVGLLEVG